MTLAIMIAGCGSDKVAVIAHRGFWKCEEAGFSENSIASLRCAQEAGLWGSECDVQLTADNVVIVNHNDNIIAPDSTVLEISEHNYAEFSECLLPNGECRPTLEQYVIQAAECPTTKLIIEFKKQKSEEREDILLDNTFKILKDCGMYDPDKVIFISFSFHMTQRVAEEAPDFTNQYLEHDKTPQMLAAMNINGMDYNYKVYQNFPEWVKEARELGLSTNTWTVNTEEVAQEMINCGVQALTTNEPLMIRNLLGSRELKNRR